MIKIQTLSSNVQTLIGRFEESQYYSEKNIKELATSKESLLGQIKDIDSMINGLRERLTSIETERIMREKQRQEEEKNNANKDIEKDKQVKKDVKEVYLGAYKDYVSGESHYFWGKRSGLKLYMMISPRALV